MTAELNILKKELIEDIQLLRSDFKYPTSIPTAPKIRAQISPILRKWICDNGLSPLCKEYKAKPLFKVINDKVEIDRCKRGEIAHWTATNNIGALGIGTGRIKPEYIHKTYRKGDDKSMEYLFKFNEFRVQKVAYINGRFVSRNESLRYLADKMGGTHSHQVTRKPRNFDLSDLLKLHGATLFPENNSWQLMNGMEPDKVSEYESQGGIVFSMLHLIALDSARRFCEGDFRPIGIDLYHTSHDHMALPASA